MSALVWTNWAGNQRCRARALHEPRSQEELAALVRRLSARGERLKVVGAGHSFSAVACADDAHLVSLRGLARIDVDAGARAATVEGGATLGEIAAALAARGLALPNACSIAEPTIAGAISTGTHGTGLGHRILADAVRAIELVLYGGDVLRVSREENAGLFDAVRLSLGALGVIARVTLTCVPAFRLEARVAPASLPEVLDRLDEHLEAEFWKLWWLPGTDLAQTVAVRRTDAPATAPRGGASRWLREDLLGYHALRWTPLLGRASARAAGALTRWISAARLAPASCAVGPAHAVLSGRIRLRKHVLELAIPAERAREALLALRAWAIEAGRPPLLPVEVRLGAADEIWLSPAYGRRTCYIGVMMCLGTPFAPVLAAVERILAPFGARPHWGKLTAHDARTLRPLYPRWDDFLAVRRALDPRGGFGSAFLERMLGEPAPARVAC